jgi:hypothetical protein
MKDYRASVEKLRRDAAEAAVIRDLATDNAKHEMFDRLHQHFNRLADEVERAVARLKRRARDEGLSGTRGEVQHVHSAQNARARESHQAYGTRAR